MVDSFTINQFNYLQARTGQPILVEIELFQLNKLPNLGRDGTCQRIFRHKPVNGRLVYHVLIGATPNRTCELVPAERQPLQVDELSNLSRDAPCTWLNHHTADNDVRKNGDLCHDQLVI